MILAAACGALAAFFAITNDFEKAFVAATAGAICWFLNYRQKLRERLPREDESDEESDEEIRS
jgi:hypothetical protein